jgi:selenide, water dikinase
MQHWPFHSGKERINQEGSEHIVILNPASKLRDVVLIGGGHAHALVLEAWGRNPPVGARLTLINPDPKAPYTGMLPGTVAGHYSLDETSIDLVRLAGFAGARLILDRAVGLDPKAQTIALAEGSPIGFDVASINVGIASAGIDVVNEGVTVLGAKPMAQFAAGWAKFLEIIAEGTAPPHAAIIGGGIGGVELALAMAYRLRSTVCSLDTVQVSLIEAGPELVPRESASLRRVLSANLLQAKVSLYLNTNAVLANGNGLTLSNGNRVRADFIAAVAGAIPPKWLGRTELLLDGGYVLTDDTLRAVGQHAVFAVGDCATVAGAPRPKAGAFAVRQAPILFANLSATLTGDPLRRYRPQKDYLKLVSLGNKNAVASKWGITAQLPGLWTLKNSIDADFMARFSNIQVP